MNCLRKRKNTTFRYSSLVYGLCANLCFSSTRVAWGLINKKCHFSAVFALFLHAVWLCIYTHAQLKILKFQDSVCQKAEVCTQAINE